MGGRSVPAEKRAFSQDPQFAAKAGRKGGTLAKAENRFFSRFPEKAVLAGRPYLIDARVDVKSADYARSEHTAGRKD